MEYTERVLKNIKTKSSYETTNRQAKETRRR